MRRKSRAEVLDANWLHAMDLPDPLSCLACKCISVQKMAACVGGLGKKDTDILIGIRFGPQLKLPHLFLPGCLVAYPTFSAK